MWEPYGAAAQPRSRIMTAQPLDTLSRELGWTSPGPVLEGRRLHLCRYSPILSEENLLTDCDRLRRRNRSKVSCRVRRS